MRKLIILIIIIYFSLISFSFAVPDYSKADFNYYVEFNHAGFIGSDSLIYINGDFYKSDSDIYVIEDDATLDKIVSKIDTDNSDTGVVVDTNTGLKYEPNQYNYYIKFRHAGYIASDEQIYINGDYYKAGLGQTPICVFEDDGAIDGFFTSIDTDNSDTGAVVDANFDFKYKPFHYKYYIRFNHGGYIASDEKIYIDGEVFKSGLGYTSICVFEDDGAIDELTTSINTRLSDTGIIVGTNTGLKYRPEHYNYYIKFDHGGYIASDNVIYVDGDYYRSDSKICVFDDDGSIRKIVSSIDVDSMHTGVVVDNDNNVNNIKSISDLPPIPLDPEQQYSYKHELVLKTNDGGYRLYTSRDLWRGMSHVEYLGTTTYEIYINLDSDQFFAKIHEWVYDAVNHEWDFVVTYGADEALEYFAGFDFSDVFYVNHDIYDFGIGKTIINRTIVDPENDEVYIVFDYPSDGKVHAQSKIKCKVSYRIPKEGNSKLRPLISNSINFNLVSHDYTEEGNYVEGSFVFTSDVEKGYTTLVASYNVDGGTNKKELTTYRSKNLVDENNDGIDDNTGEPVTDDLIRQELNDINNKLDELNAKIAEIKQILESINSNTDLAVTNQKLDQLITAITQIAGEVDFDSINSRLDQLIDEISNIDINVDTDSMEDKLDDINDNLSELLTQISAQNNTDMSFDAIGVRDNISSKFGVSSLSNSLSRLETMNTSKGSVPKITINLNDIFSKSMSRINPNVPNPFSNEESTLIDFSMFEEIQFLGFSIIDYFRNLIGVGFIWTTFLYVWRKIIPNKTIGY